MSACTFKTHAVCTNESKWWFLYPPSLLSQPRLHVTFDHLLPLDWHLSHPRAPLFHTHTRCVGSAHSYLKPKTQIHNKMFVRPEHKINSFCQSWCKHHFENLWCQKLQQHWCVSFVHIFQSQLDIPSWSSHLSPPCLEFSHCSVVCVKGRGLYYFLFNNKTMIVLSFLSFPYTVLKINLAVGMWNNFKCCGKIIRNYCHWI